MSQALRGQPQPQHDSERLGATAACRHIRFVPAGARRRNAESRRRGQGPAAAAARGGRAGALWIPAGPPRVPPEASRAAARRGGAWGADTDGAARGLGHGGSSRPEPRNNEMRAGRTRRPFLACNESMTDGTCLTIILHISGHSFPHEHISYPNEHNSSPRTRSLALDDSSQDGLRGHCIKCLIIRVHDLPTGPDLFKNLQLAKPCSQLKMCVSKTPRMLNI